LRNLTPASGCQDHTTSPYASRAFVLRAFRVHRIPRRTSVTIAKRPSCGHGMGRSYSDDLPDRQSGIFSRNGLDITTRETNLICPSGSFLPARHLNTRGRFGARLVTRAVMCNCTSENQSRRGADGAMDMCVPIGSLDPPAYVRLEQPGAHTPPLFEAVFASDFDLAEPFRLSLWSLRHEPTNVSGPTRSCSTWLRTSCAERRLIVAAQDMQFSKRSQL
jgi:hypothetical protein